MASTLIPLQSLASSFVGRPFIRIFLAFILCSLFYVVFFSLGVSEEHPQQFLEMVDFEFCPDNYTNYCPCQDPRRQKRFSNFMWFRKERHCPNISERLRCLIPKPLDYQKPFTWPESKDTAWFSNVPFPKLAEYKKSQNWVRLEGDRFAFPGGGTSFPEGVKGYVDTLNRILPLESGDIRTALDVGCGVASFGASLMDYNILTMSVAPSDEHEAQVQFALERGLPALLGVLSVHRLPFPSRSFDMAHCSRCLVQWAAYDGLYLLEIDRLLRPGGYWVLSGPPINWRENYRAWQREPEFFEREQNILEDLAKRMCWKKVAERDGFAVWQKPTNHVHCIQVKRIWPSPAFCNSTDADAGWYTKMTACIFPLPDVNDIREVSGGALEKWPARLNTASPRIKNEANDGIRVRDFDEDTQTWKRRLLYYKSMLKSFSSGEYRNVMDMNADLGGFAAAMVEHPVWVMNVVPFDATHGNLGVVYERGLIGTYMDWCEPFSTYPRTYDLIHASGIFSMYMDKCDIAYILLEMHRILRPGGTVIIRDHTDIIARVKRITGHMKWKGKVLQSENGPSDPASVLLIDNAD
ncbi:probable methyltransferase PMT19 [Prosopis cineraria]|uniref:probable methyltransferase PMT19 n=1 Tax=Prosopis cineraria TaxID=364024 RepID=UPI00240FF3E9|nr:probable methyltransferase PMT19 [Prosopis cineraria]